MKKCFICGEIKELSEFHRHKQMKDGHLNKCKVCTIKYVKQHYQDNYERSRKVNRLSVSRNYYANREARLAQMKQYYLDNPDKAEAKRQYASAYAKANRDRTPTPSTTAPARQPLKVSPHQLKS